MGPIADRKIADTRVFKSDYFLPPEFVDQYANEVKRLQPDRSTQQYNNNTNNRNDETTMDTDDQAGSTDGGPNDIRNEACAKNWKAAASKKKKMMWGVFKETGIFASVCQHGLILWITDMISSG